MQIPLEILLVISSVGAIQSAFFSIYLWFLKKGNRKANHLLSLLLLAFAVRMVKSVSYYFSADHRLPLLFENLGFAAQTLIAPLLFLYLKAFLKRDFVFQRSNWLHLLPGIIVVALSPWIPERFWLNQYGYQMILYAMAAYFPFCFLILRNNFSKLDTTEKTWLVSLVIGVTLVWAAYSANFLLGWVSYITAPVIFSFVMYIMSYLGLRQNSIFVQEPRYKNSTLQADEAKGYINRLLQLMTDTQIYKEHDLTLPKLARRLNLASHLLSQVINEHLQQSFPDFINKYRVMDAKDMLVSQEYLDQKISSVAYDNGFNTLSSFNSAFKKYTQMTPSEYRKKYSQKKIHV